MYYNQNILLTFFDNFSIYINIIDIQQHYLFYLLENGKSLINREVERMLRRRIRDYQLYTGVLKCSFRGHLQHIGNIRRKNGVL